MNVIEPMQSTGGRFLPARLRSVILWLCAVSLAGCSSPTVVTPKIPEPAADLMTPAPTGSQVLGHATQNMQSWLEMLQNGQTR